MIKFLWNGFGKIDVKTFFNERRRVEGRLSARWWIGEWPLEWTEKYICINKKPRFQTFGNSKDFSFPRKWRRFAELNCDWQSDERLDRQPVWQTDATFGCGSDLTSNGRGNLLEIFSVTLVCETVTAGTWNSGGSVDTSDRLWSLLGQKRHFLDGILGRILEREEATFLQSSSWHLRIFTTLWAEKIWFNVKVWIAITIQLTGYQKLKFCKMAVDPPVSHGDDDDPDRVDEEAPLLLIPTSQQPAPCRLLENPCLPCATIIFVIAATVLAYQIKIILLDPWSVRINHMPHKIGIPDSNWNGIVWTKHVSHLWVAQVYLGLEIRYSDRTGVRHCSQPEGGTGDPCGAMGGAWGCSQGSVDPGVRWSTAVEKLEQDPAHWNLSWLYPHGERLETHHNWNFIRLYCCWND